jgi:TetR/AcrR family transcriptional repressor of nem operon
MVPRLKGFDRDEVLERAMHLFWDGGYNATSIQDLEARLGINRTSLYREFGSKHSLFLAVLDRYRDETITIGLQALVSSPEGLEAIRKFFDFTVEALSEGGWRSCLMSNSAAELSRHDPDTAQRTGAHMNRVEDAFLGALTRAQALGELSPGADLHALASYLNTIQHGLGVVGKATGDPERLRRSVETVMQLLHRQIG